MKRIYISSLLILLWIFNYALGEKRRSPIPIESLTNPESLDYIPHPYPKTKEEIIKDIKFQIKKKDKLKIRKNLGRIKKNPLINILNEKTSLKIGSIIKVKNRMSTMSHDYYWLILIMNNEKDLHSILKMDANGIYLGNSGFKCPYAFCPDGLLKSKEEILEKLSIVIGRKLNRTLIKKMELVSFQTFEIASIGALIWEIILTDDTIYYFSVISGRSYKIIDKIPLTKNVRNEWLNPRLIVPEGHNHLADTIKEEIYVLKEL